MAASSEREALEFLKTAALFSGLDEHERSHLASVMKPVHLLAGETLLTEGEEGDDLYVVVNGRLRALVERADGASSVVGEAGAGEVVGEMSLLSDEPRSATVRAVRDTNLYRLDRNAFLGFVNEHPEGLLAVTQQLIRRLRRTNRAGERVRRIGTLAVLPIGDPVLAPWLAGEIVEALTGWGEVVSIDRARVDGHFGPTAVDAEPGTSDYGDITRWLHETEIDRDLVVYVCDPTPTGWTHRSLRQADRVLLVVAAGDSAEITEAERWLFDHSDTMRPHTELVVVQPAGARVGRATRRFLEKRRVDRVVHVGADGTRVDRLVRLLTGQATGVVFSGGGARGLAHVGVVKALLERDIPIDIVGGTSIGATVAAGLAMGWSYEELLEHELDVTVRQGSLVDFTAPATALARGTKLSEGIRLGYGEAHIEDLMTEFFCMSSDLTAGKPRLHERGMLWRAVRASVAIPGIFPPLRAEDGHVLVDGGVMDNLPATVMRARLGSGTVIAIDLRARINLASAELPADGILSGWRVLGRRFNPMRTRLDVPRMIDVLLRVTEVASNADDSAADVVFRPDVEQFALLDFRSYRQIVDAGYHHASDLLEDPEVKDILGVVT